MANVFDKFDKTIDVKGLKADLAEQSKNGGKQFEEVPHGTYVVKLNRAELKESKSGKPMVAMRFKIIEGERKNSIIFYNQVCTQAFQIHIVNEMLRNLCDNTVPVDFENFKQWNDTILEVFEKSSDYEYALEYKAGKNGFSEYSIKEVFDAESE